MKSWKKSLAQLRTPKSVKPSLPEYVSWMYFYDEGIVVTKNSNLLAFFEFESHGDYYSADYDDALTGAFNRFLMSLPDLPSGMSSRR